MGRKFRKRGSSKGRGSRGRKEMVSVVGVGQVGWFLGWSRMFLMEQ